MKIAILAKDVDHIDFAERYFLILLQQGHAPMFVDGNAAAAVQQMVEDGVDGILKLSDGDEIHDEIAARFFRETGRPVWHNMTEIPHSKPN
jgi:hypothetical protein